MTNKTISDGDWAFVEPYSNEKQEFESVETSEKDVVLVLEIKEEKEHNIRNHVVFETPPEDPDITVEDYYNGLNPEQQTVIVVYASKIKLSDYNNRQQVIEAFNNDQLDIKKYKFPIELLTKVTTNDLSMIPSINE